MATVTFFALEFVSIFLAFERGYHPALVVLKVLLAIGLFSGLMVLFMSKKDVQEIKEALSGWRGDAIMVANIIEISALFYYGQYGLVLFCLGILALTRFAVASKTGGLF